MAQSTSGLTGRHVFGLVGGTKDGSRSTILIVQSMRGVREHAPIEKPKGTTSYSEGRAQAWACLLHFRVFDLILATQFRTIVQPFSMAGHTPSQLRTSLLLEPLCRWPSKLEQFNEQLQSSHLEKNTGAPILSDSTDGAAESRKTVIAFSKIEGQTLQDKTTKNLQAMAAGLVWILELGSKDAPVLTESNTVAIAPLSSVKSRLRSLGDKDAETTAKLDKTTPIQFLRTLSYCMSLSPALIFCDIDLTTMHIDMDIELELSQCMRAAGPRSPTLMQVEQFVHTLCRGSSGTSSAEKVIAQNFATFMQKIPPLTMQDAATFTGTVIRNIYNSRLQAVFRRYS
ncbi:hypothetical protein B0H14DRAFT_2635784 [Mycena olivaceomarginata]|nr:hypothetical protein B0H14DRAFT_2635784 [Mycena olivaceomarginata]